MYNTIAVIAGFAVLEQVFNGYKWPKQPYWVLRGIFWFALLIGTSHLLGRYLDPYAHGLTLFDLSGWGIWGAPVALFFYEVLVYFVHRAQHRVDFLWRMHQWHHSSERIDIWSAVRTHPLELPLFHIVGLIAFAVVFNLSKETSGGLMTFLLLIQYIQHTNVKTPRWLGYIIVRPENHMLHHARDNHHSNYSDLPIVDMIFGTFENPKEPPAEFGFWNGASTRVVDHLLCRDNTSEPKSEASVAS